MSVSFPAESIRKQRECGCPEGGCICLIAPVVKRAGPPLKGVMGILDGEWASSRIVGDPHSSIVDLPLTAVQGELLSVAAWCDNEMGY